MEGKVIVLKASYDEFNNIVGYEAVIEFLEEPALKLGKCYVSQEKRIFR